MDEDFEYFLEKMGPAFGKRYVPTSSIERYRGKLPNQLLDYWKEHGWCGYADGLFWTVNPQEYDPVVEQWIGETPFMEKDAYHIIARSAFGDLYFWGERAGDSLKIFAPGAYAVSTTSVLIGDKSDLGIRTFFACRDGLEDNFSELFAPALKKLGPLKHDEMYGFVPALALGGSATLDHLQKVKAVEHLVLLAQLSELRVMEVPSK
jgi:hypothetical protein